jgi:hypothetical protein
MATMIKLHLPSGSSFGSVQHLPGLAALPLDETFGLLPIDPKNALYVVRTSESIGDLAERQRLSPEILGVYGDVRVSST